MTALNIYLTHPVSRELLGQGLADPDPLEADNWLIPAHAYTDKPPIAGTGETVIRGKDGWEVVPDHRGTVYRIDTGAAQQYAQLGELPTSLTATPPPGPEYAWTGTAWQMDPTLKLQLQNKVMGDLCKSIDTSADTARRAVAGDPLRAVEYDRSATEAQAFKAAGYPADAVPRTVAAWAINGRTAQQAADSILAEAAAYTEALYQIRETRLQAKELVRQAMAAGNPALAQDIAAETIASIEAAVAGVGNAGA